MNLDFLGIYLIYMVSWIFGVLATYSTYSGMSMKSQADSKAKLLTWNFQNIPEYSSGQNRVLEYLGYSIIPYSRSKKLEIKK